DGDGGPELTLVSQMGPDPVGSLRRFDGDATVVYVGITVDAIGLDSHMMFAFTPPDSAVPHFTLDSVLAGPHNAFHLDLIPRVDPGANLAYLDHCFQPLTEAHDSAREIEGLELAHLSPRQWQLMSAWMLANRADDAGFAAIDPIVDTYRDHWLGLVTDGLPADVVDASAQELAARDGQNRAAIFNQDVDPVWAQIDRLLGEDTSADIQQRLRDAGREDA
ncbi:MAG: hypothetical protein AAGK32_02035, partial [Actinomycetota bacterium]